MGQRLSEQSAQFGLAEPAPAYLEKADQEREPEPIVVGWQAIQAASMRINNVSYTHDNKFKQAHLSHGIALANNERSFYYKEIESWPAIELWVF